MKVLISCVIKIDPKQRDQALEGADELIQLALKEHGCLAYTWAADKMLDDTIHVFEEWEDQESLAAHFTAPSFFGMSEHLGKHGLLGAEAKKYLVSKESGIYDEEGNPRADFF